MNRTGKLLISHCPVVTILTGARALDQMSVPPPPPPLPGQHKPAYSTADTAVSTAATTQQQQQQQSAVISLSSGSAAAAAGAASADSRPGSTAAAAAGLEANEGSQQLLMTAEINVDLDASRSGARPKQRQSGLKESETASQQLGVEPGSLSPAAEREEAPQQRQQRQYVREKGVPAAGELAAAAAAAEQAEEPVVHVQGNALEPRYCVCDNVAYGKMVQCDNDHCCIGWFHYACVGMTGIPKGKWYCQACSEQMQRAGDLAAAHTAGMEGQPAGLSEQAAGTLIVDDGVAKDSEQQLPDGSAGMDVDQATMSGHAAAAAGGSLPLEEVIELLSEDDDIVAEHEHVVQQATVSHIAPAVVNLDHKTTAPHEFLEPDVQTSMPGSSHLQPGGATVQQQPAGAAPPAAKRSTKTRSRPTKLEVANPGQQLRPSAATAAAADAGSDDAIVEQQPPQAAAAAGDGDSATMEQQGTVVSPAADVQQSLGALEQANLPVSAAANAQQQQMQQWQWLQAWQTNRALSAAMQQPVSSEADTAAHMQLNSSQQQLNSRTSSGHAAASGASAPPYKLNAPKSRLPAAVRAAAAAAAAADSAGTALDSKDTSATAAGSSGTAAAGVVSPSSTFKRRTPQDMRRMVVRNLHALIGPHTESAWQEFVKRGTTRGAQPSLWQCEAFMAEVFGDQGGPNAALWPGAEDLRPEGVMGYLARTWIVSIGGTPNLLARHSCFAILLSCCR